MSIFLYRSRQLTSRMDMNKKLAQEEGDVKTCHQKPTRDEVFVTASALPASKYRRARCENVALDDPFQLGPILALKEEADKTEKWESVFDTQIYNPQPNDVYYRQYKTRPGPTPPFKLALKESRDGYTWERFGSEFFTEDWSVLYMLFYNITPNGDTHLNPIWKKLFYIFPNEQKIIIHYSGCNKNAG